LRFSANTKIHALDRPMALGVIRRRV